MCEEGGGEGRTSAEVAHREAAWRRAFSEGPPALSPAEQTSKKLGHLSSH